MLESMKVYLCSTHTSRRGKLFPRNNITLPVLSATRTRKTPTTTRLETPVTVARIETRTGFLTSRTTALTLPMLTSLIPMRMVLEMSVMTMMTMTKFLTPLTIVSSSPMPISRTLTACDDYCDGDGVSDLEDVCPCHKHISRTDFRAVQSIDLGNNGQSAPIWTFKDEGKEIFQDVNSSPGVAIGDTKFSEVQYEGTFFIHDKNDDDWVGAVFAFQVCHLLH